MAINSRLTLDNKQFRLALEQSSGAIGAMVADASMRMQTLYAQTDALNNRLNRGIGRFAADLQSVGKSLAIGVSLPLLGLAGASLQAYGQIDSLKRGLFSIEKTAENTEARFNSLKEVAALPGLGLEEAVKGDIRLRAVGISADLSKKSLLEFGNAIALTGGGKADLDRVTVQLAQMSAKSKVLAQDLKPIIEAAPSVSQALQKMFGTVDSEEISKKLKAKGLNSTDFIGLMVKQMEKLPRVTGGIKNAMENMGDSLKVAGYEFGQILDKSFGLSDMLNGLGGFIEKAVQAFKGLSPELQKGILAFGGMLAVVGPLILAVGTIGSMFASGGLLAGGLAAITGPIGIAALAIVGLGTLIVSNWDTIKKTLKDTGIWDGLAAVVQGTVDIISGAFSLLKKIVVGVVSGFKQAFNTDTTGIFSVLKTIISTSLTVIGNVFSIFGKALSGDWGGVFEGLKNIVKSMFNGMVSIVATNVGTILNLTSKLLDGLGATDKAKGLRSVAEDVANFAKIIQFNVPKSASMLDGLAKSIEGAMSGGGGSTPNFKGGGDGKGKAKKDGKDIFQENSTKLVAEALKIQSELYKKANEGNLRTEIEYLTQEFQEKQKAIQNETASESAKHIALLAAEEQFQANLKAIRDKYKEPDLLKMKGANLGGIGSKFADGSEGFGKLQSVGSPTNPLADKLKSAIPTLEEHYAKMNDTTRNSMTMLNEQLSGGLSNAASTALAGLGGLIGAMAVGNASFGDVGEMLIGTLGNMFGQMGEQMITAGIGLATLSLGITNPFAMIAAGVALTALKGALSSTVSKTTGGGGGGRSGGGSGFSNPPSQNGGAMNYKPIEILITGDSITRGADIYTSYTNQKTYTDRVRRR